MLHAGTVMDNQGKKIKQFTGKEDHFGNFIRALPDFVLRHMRGWHGHAVA